MKTIAKINANDTLNGAVIYFLVDENTFEVTTSNGDKVTDGDTPKSAAEAFELIDGQYGKLKTFEWLGKYNPSTNGIRENN